jgi:hypothetical protein
VTRVEGIIAVILMSPALNAALERGQCSRIEVLAGIQRHGSRRDVRKLASALSEELIS